MATLSQRFGRRRVVEDREIGRDRDVVYLVIAGLITKLLRR